MADRRGADQRSDSLLVAELGRGSLRAVLLERVEGRMRFLAKAETRRVGDVTNTWYGLLEELEGRSGHRLLDHDLPMLPQRARGDGVDGVLVCSSLDETVRVVLLESGKSPVVGPVTETLQRIEARMVHLSAQTGKRDKAGEWAAAQATTIREFKPELAIVVVGPDAKDEPRLLQVVQHAREALADAKVVIAADPARQQQQIAALGPGARVRGIDVANMSPAALAAEIEREVQEIHASRAGHRDADALMQEAGQQAVSQTRAVDLVTRFVARAFRRHVISLGLDDGVHAHWASGDQGASVVLTDLDLGPNVAAFTEQELGEAAAWLPFAADGSELLDWVLNRSIRPWTSPDDPRDMAIEQALTRLAFRRAIREINRTQPLALARSDLVVGGSWLARWNQPGAAALVLLDSLDVVPDDGVVDLALDRDGLMPVAGTLATVDATLASQVFEHDGLIHLGSAVVVGGQAREGELACRGEIEYENGKVTRISVAAGTVEVLPLRAGETASLTLRPERRYSIGGKPSGKAVELTGERRVVGGAVGILIDARGRSLATGETAARQGRMKNWLAAVNAPTHGLDG